MSESGATEAFATGFIAAIAGRFTAAVEMPCAGAPRDRFGPGIRVKFHHPYAIYYKIVADSVVIVRVLHGARDAEALASQGGFNASDRLDG